LADRSVDAALKRRAQETEGIIELFEIAQPGRRPSAREIEVVRKKIAGDTWWRDAEDALTQTRHMYDEQQREGKKPWPYYLNVAFITGPSNIGTYATQYRERWKEDGDLWWARQDELWWPRNEDGSRGRCGLLMRTPQEVHDDWLQSITEMRAHNIRTKGSLDPGLRKILDDAERVNTASLGGLKGFCDYLRETYDPLIDAAWEAENWDEVDRLWAALDREIDHMWKQYKGITRTDWRERRDLCDRMIAWCTPQPTNAHETIEAEPIIKERQTL
jgi:hypothetical protein